MNIVENYVNLFNDGDNELYKNYIDNKQAAAWMAEEIPILECPDKDIERTYYFRWWTYRKHIKNTNDGFVISEFLPNVPWAGRHNVINAPVGHHINEGRWLKNAHKYLDDYINLMLSDAEDVKSHQYSSWLIYAILDYYKVAGFGKNLRGLLDKACAYHSVWEEKQLLSNGMFWSTDLPDCMEFSISGRNGFEETRGIRPTLNSYMYADRTAIAEIAEMLGEDEIEQEYRKKADNLRALINENLYYRGFYRAFHNKNGDMNFDFDWNKATSVRELLGYIPWMFDIPVKKDDAAFDLLTDKSAFYAKMGLTTAEQSHERFLYKAEHECTWNGYVWPYATSQTLTALRNYFTRYSNEQRYKDMFVVLLKQYAKSHTIMDETGREKPWIDEMLHPYKKEWTTRKWLEEHNYPQKKGPFERGKDYNHSTFCDLVITGLAGVRNDREEFYIEPNIPGEWDYFKLSNLWFRGECYTIEYRDNKWSIICEGK